MFLLHKILPCLALNNIDRKNCLTEFLVKKH